MRNAAPLRVAIADDEPLVRAHLRRLLSDHPVEIVGEYADGASVLDALSRTNVDLVLLDIQMPRLNGLEAANRLTAVGGPCVVFVTAYDEHAIDAIRANAVDYLLKPVDPLELAGALERVRARVARGRGSITRLTVRSRSGMIVLDLAAVDRIVAQGNYVMAFAAGRGHLLRQTLSSLEAQLDPRRFARVHRSAIISLSAVREVQPWFRGEYVALLASGAKVRIGATYRDGFFARLETVVD